MKKNTVLEEDLNFIYSNHRKKNYLKDKKILVTGAGGFLGFYLSKYLSNFKDKLKIKDLYLTSLNIKNLKNNKFKGAKIVKFDVAKDKLSKFKVNFDIIIHAASIASPTYYRKKPLQTMESNVTGLWKILEFYKNKKAKIFYFSSSEVYGDPIKENIPTKESYNGNVNCLGPRACYDESKRFCETLCLEYARKFKNLKIVIVRPFNNFGPGMNINDARLPADLAKQALKRKNFILYSNGKPKRTFCYISDAITGYLNALSCNKLEVFNIGSIEELTIKEFAILFKKASKKILNFNPKILFKKSKDINYLKDNPNRRCPDLSNSKIKINYKPKIKTFIGIQKYLKFLKYEN
jgi:UDP-glucuronate decarboxylase